MNTTITQITSFDNFSKIELEVGTVLEAEEVDGNEN